jgi:hypothetical protein
MTFGNDAFKRVVGSSLPASWRVGVNEENQ